MYVHKSSLRQSNKPFKGRSSSNKNKFLKGTRRFLRNSLKSLSKKDRENQRKQIRNHKIKLRNEKRKEIEGHSEVPILCTIVPFNSHCDPISIIKSIADYICENFPGNVPSEILLRDYKVNTVFNFQLDCRRLSICIAKYNNILDSLDSIKCSDIIFASFGPNNDYQAFDEFGYKLLKSMKLQGQPNVIGIFSFKNESYNLSHCIECEKVIRKSFEMEFNKDSKFFSISEKSDVRSIISSIPCIYDSSLNLRDGRGYVLSESSSIKINGTNIDEKKQLIIKGFIRGVGLSLDFPVHVTGFGDFTIDSISPINFNICDFNSKNTQFNTENVHKRNVLDNGTLNRKLSNLIDFNETKNSLNSSMGKCNQESTHMKIDIPFTSSSERMQLDPDSNTNIGSDMEVEDKFSLERFQEREILKDERKVGQDTICRTRFAKYRGLDSLRTSDWNPYENLPDEYSRICEIEFFKKTAELSKKIYFESCKKEDFLGKYCEISLIPISSETSRMLTQENICEKYIILSSILPFERKVGLMNFRVKRTPENTDLIKNKTPIILQAGFRRFYICPTFSDFPRLSSTNTIERNQILKLNNFFTHGKHFIVSCYCTMIFPPCPIMLFSISKNEDTPAKERSYKYFSNFEYAKINDWPLAWGDVVDADPYRVIVKRIILVGSLFKIRKCKGVVRFMFNNPEDVKWFKSIGLKTRSGIRGVIKEPLGMHGYMKCLFSKPLQQNEVVGMHIYKRVFPKWFPISWFESEDSCNKL